VVLTHLDGQPVPDPAALRAALDTKADAPQLARVHRRDGTRAFYDIR
jgi:S1-C subfamily serine protease